MGQQGPWLAGWLAEAPSGLTEVVAVSAHSRTGSPGATDLLPAQVTLAQVYAGSAGRTADGAGGAGSPGQVVKEAHSPSWPHPPALLRYLGKYQASGLKMSGVFLGASGGRGLKPKTNFTSSAISSLPQSLTEKAVELVSITYLPMYTHIPTKSPSWISTPGCKGSACIVSNWCLPRPAPPAACHPHNLQRAEQTLFRFIGYTRVGVTGGSCPVCPTQCARGPSLTGAVK